MSLCGVSPPSIFFSVSPIWFTGASCAGGGAACGAGAICFGGTCLACANTSLLDSMAIEAARQAMLRVAAKGRTNSSMGVSSVGAGFS